MPFAALVLAAVLFKLLGHQVFTPLSVGVAGFLWVVRWQLDIVGKRAVEILMLQFGVLLYALANQDPSYYEHAALAICLLPTLQRLRLIARAGLAEGSLLVLLLYIVWSVCWTSKLDMSVAGFVMSGLCLAFLIGYVLQFEGDLNKIFGHVLVVLAAVMIGSWVAGGMGIGAAGKTFSGVTLHRNQLGFLLGLLILLCLFVVRWRFRWLHLAGAVAATGLLIYIDSKSAIISIALTSLVFLVISARRWKVLVGLLALGMAIFITALPSPKMDHFALWVGRDPTFTSRTEIWEDSIKLATQQPFTGYGYNAVWSAHENRLAQYRNAPGPQYAHAHNAWIDWVLQLGLGGLAVYILFLGVLLKRALDHTRSPALVPLAIQAACLVLYIQVYDLANVSTIPVTRFGFFMMAVTTLCLWYSSADNERKRSTYAAGDAAGRFQAGFGSRVQPQAAKVRLRHVLGLGVVGFAALVSYALWEDGRRFSSAEKPSKPVANGIAGASYLDARQFQWQTPQRLQDYARRHRDALRVLIDRSDAP